MLKYVGSFSLSLPSFPRICLLKSVTSFGIWPNLFEVKGSFDKVKGVDGASWEHGLETDFRPDHS